MKEPLSSVQKSSEADAGEPNAKHKPVKFKAHEPRAQDIVEEMMVFKHELHVNFTMFV